MSSIGGIHKNPILLCCSMWRRRYWMLGRRQCFVCSQISPEFQKQTNLLRRKPTNPEQHCKSPNPPRNLISHTHLAASKDWAVKDSVELPLPHIEWSLNPICPTQDLSVFKDPVVGLFLRTERPCVGDALQCDAGWCAPHVWEDEINWSPYLRYYSTAQFGGVFLNK